jgi:thiol-disulfide isomerase/thioredoxin
MKNISIIVVLLSLLTLSTGYSQNIEIKTVKLDKTAINLRNEGVPLFKLTGNKLEVEDKTVPIKIPKEFPTTKLNAYFFFLYEAAGSDLGLVLVADYTSVSPVLYFDKNKNFDFTDDGAPILFKGGNAEIKLQNLKYPKGVTTLSFSKLVMDDEKEKKWLEMQKFLGKSPKAEFTLPRYWLNMNPIAKVGQFQLNETDYTIGFYDANQDGIVSKDFVDDVMYSGDRLLLAEGRQDTLSFEFTKNGYKIFEEVISLSTAQIKIEEFDPISSYVKVSLTDLPPTVRRLKEGEVLENFTYTSVENPSSSNIYALKGNGKYKLIEFWGTWCKGCVQIIPELRALHSDLGNRLDIVSLNFNDKSLEKVARFIKEKDMVWHQGYSTLELNRKLGVQMFPYSILLDEDFRIIALQTTPDFVKKHLIKTGEKK